VEIVIGYDEKGWVRSKLVLAL